MRHRNRLSSRNSKSGRTYCGKCDGGLVGEGGKCQRCGWKFETKHGKKKDLYLHIEDAVI